MQYALHPECLVWQLLHQGTPLLRSQIMHWGRPAPKLKEKVPSIQIKRHEICILSVKLLLKYSGCHGNHFLGHNNQYKDVIIHHLEGLQV